MSCRCFLRTAIILAFFVLAAFSVRVPPSTAYPAIDFSAVIAAHNADSVFPDSVLIVGDKTGNLLVHNKGAFTMDSAFPIASSSKWLCATVAKSLVSQGLMSFSDKPQKYITWWTNDPTDPRSNITIFDLLSFTSGFLGDMERHPTNKTLTDCIGTAGTPFEQCIKLVYDTCYLFGGAGKVFDYGSTHMGVFALMAMKATGLNTWNNVAQTHLSAKMALNMSLPYGRNPAGGAYFTPLDYEIFLRHHYLKNATFYDPIMELDYTPKDKIRINYAPIGEGYEWHYCLGHWIECLQTNFTQECLDLQIYSSAGSHGNYPWIDRVNDYYAILGRDDGTLARAGAESVALGVILKPLIIAALNKARSPSTTSPSPVAIVQPSPAPSIVIPSSTSSPSSLSSSSNIEKSPSFAPPSSSPVSQPGPLSLDSPSPLGIDSPSSGNIDSASPIVLSDTPSPDSTPVDCARNKKGNCIASASAVSASLSLSFIALLASV